MDKAIECVTKECCGCQLIQNNPKAAPLQPWKWSARPWQRIHVDFAGPFLGTMFLIVVDAHSKWPEMVPMTSTTTTRTIEELRKIFATHRLPEQVVSDNGPQFIAEEFKSVHDEQCHWAHQICTIPSSYQWARRTFCANFQASSSSASLNLVRTELMAHEESLNLLNLVEVTGLMTHEESLNSS